MLRRDFMRAMLLAAPAAAATAQDGAFALSTIQQPTLLWARRGKDEYQLDIATEAGYRAAAWLLRDVRANVVGYPDWKLLQLMCWMQSWLAAYGNHIRFDLHSGLRTPATNKRTEGSAQASYHLPDSSMGFRAVDFSARPVPSNYMGQLAIYAAQGGVGFYPNDNFTHIDTGPRFSSRTGTPRNWVKR